MPIVQVGSARMSYWMGKGETPDKRETILFVHGAGGGQFTWSCQKAFFEKRAHPVIVELPGHGASGGAGEADIGRYADHVHSFIKVLGLRKMFLVGHSMGGAIVQTLALLYPEIIKGIVLVGTGAKLKVLPMVLSGIKNDFQETVRKIARFAYARKAPPELIEQGVSQLMQCPPDILYGDFLACDRFDLMPEVEKIDLPALIVCGEEDELTPVKCSQFLHGRIRGSTLEVLPGAGHMVMMESPVAFNEKLNEFISSCAGARSVSRVRL